MAFEVTRSGGTALLRRRLPSRGRLVGSGPRHATCMRPLLCEAEAAAAAATRPAAEGGDPLAVGPELEQQLRRELEIALAGRVAAPLGADMGGTVRTRTDSQALLLASQLSSGNRRIAGTLTTRLLDEVLYPDHWAPVQWWSTPLGFALARRYRPNADAVTSVTEAGELLDLTDQAVTDLVADGGPGAGPKRPTR